jgi:hypothetical protein
MTQPGTSGFTLAVPGLTVTQSCCLQAANKVKLQNKRHESNEVEFFLSHSPFTSP